MNRIRIGQLRVRERRARDLAVGSDDISARIRNRELAELYAAEIARLIVAGPTPP